MDGVVFDLLADVKKRYGGDGGYVYTIRLKENKKIKASPPSDAKTGPVRLGKSTLTSEDSITDSVGSVNQFSLKSDAAMGEILRDTAEAEDVAKTQSQWAIGEYFKKNRKIQKALKRNGFSCFWWR